MNVRASDFKYYIHDGIDSCRLQLIGTVSDQHLRELNGCWRTVSTTLNGRSLVIDLSQAEEMADPVRQWIATLRADGATVIEQTERGEAERPCPLKRYTRTVKALSVRVTGR